MVLHLILDLFKIRSRTRAGRELDMVLGKQFRWRMIIRRLLLSRALSKGWEAGPRNVLSSGFRVFSAWNYEF